MVAFGAGSGASFTYPGLSDTLEDNNYTRWYTVFMIFIAMVLLMLSVFGMIVELSPFGDKSSQ